MRTVAVIGLGWLGLELADCLKTKDYSVVGTVQTTQKRDTLRPQLNEVLAFQLGDSIEKLNFSAAMDYLVLSIPPSSSAQYVEQMMQITMRLKEQTPLLRIIYTSSTSVYGRGNREVDEASRVKPETPNAKKMVALEHFLLGNFSEECAIIRLAGLVGGSRHPIFSLSGRKGVRMPRARVNLIHRDDVTRFILMLVDDFKPGVYNLSCPEHPEKETYYKWAAEQKNIATVLFDKNDEKLDKVVNCNAIKTMDFEFKYNSPYDFPM